MIAPPKNPSLRPPALMAVLALGLAASAAVPAALAGQIPEEFENLQVLPPDISRDSLIQTMRGFSFALGVRCTHCHVSEDETTVTNPFSLDDRAAKAKARFMIEMTARLNDEVLPDLPGLDGPPLRIECKTCHRGVSRPYLLAQELHRTLLADGVDAAVARYRELRETRGLAGAYDFGEWEMNEYARKLAGDGWTDAAIAMLELNEEFYPASRSIPLMLGGNYEAAGRIEDAIAAYRRALERNPDSRTARERLEALGASPGG